MKSDSKKGRTGTRLKRISDEALDHVIGGTQEPTHAAVPTGFFESARAYEAQHELHEATSAAATEPHHAIPPYIPPPAVEQALEDIFGAAHRHASAPSHAVSDHDQPHNVAPPPHVGVHADQGFGNLEKTRSHASVPESRLHDSAETSDVKDHVIPEVRGRTTIERAHDLPDHRVSPINDGDEIGHVNADLTHGEQAGVHTLVQTHSSTATIINKQGVTERADASVEAERGVTYRDGPLALEAKVAADAKVTGEAHIGKDGIDLKGDADAHASASGGVSVSGKLGHNVSGTVGVEDTAEAHAHAGAQVSTHGVAATGDVGVSNVTSVGGAIKVQAGHGITVDNEAHVGVVEVATAGGHAGVGADGIGAGMKGVVGTYEQAGVSVKVGNEHYNGQVGGDIHGPGALGFKEDTSANFHDGKVTLNVTGSIDLGLVGFDLRLSANLDIAGLEHRVEQTVESAAKHLGAVLEAAGHTFAHQAGVGGHELAWSVHQSEHVVTQMGQDVKQVAVQVGQDVKHVAVQVGQDVKQVAVQAAQETKQVATQIGNDAKQTTVQVAHQAEQAVTQVAHDVQHVAAPVVHEIEHVAAPVVHEVQHTVAAVVHEAAPVVHAVEHVAQNVGHGIKKFFRHW